MATKPGCRNEPQGFSGRKSDGARPVFLPSFLHTAVTKVVARFEQFREQKISKLVHFLTTGYQESYGNVLPTIHILTPVSQHHAVLLKRWTEAELEYLNQAMTKAQRFRIAYLPKAAFTPDTLFWKKLWIEPFQNKYIAISESKG